MLPAPLPWGRPYHALQGGIASVTLFAFAERSLELAAPVSRSRYGVPAEFDFARLDIRRHLLSEAPEWFGSFFTPEMLCIAEHDLGNLAGRLTDLEVVYSVQLELEEPTDLAYLQACWGAAAWICDSGAQLVHDAAAARWHSSERIAALEPLREFAIEHEVAVVFETDCTPGFGHVTHTRGLVKFGRPDVVLLGAEPGDARACAVLLNGLARQAALGAPLMANQTVSPNNLQPRRLAPYEPGTAHPQVHLNNDGVILDISGWGLRDLE